MLKLFISYSSKDRQVVKWIDRELEDRGFKSHMDVEFLEGGEDIAEEIRERIKDCDEIVIVLSPNSLNSPWVHYETACADMMGKRIIPLLLCLDQQQVPSLFNKYLSRPINEFDLLANAIMRRAKSKSSGNVQPEQAVTVSREGEGFSPGTDVKIPEMPPPTVVRSSGHLIRWRGEMDPYFGHSASVVEYDSASGAVRLDVDGGEFWWAIDWLTRQG
ncbi:MAG: toll/interleukin-1 receptor domain-containing protein [Verrucomicrobiales bacterium]|nr:toll/interleukin-1 receptor domain-containing protein [Verrucomicrobiales bacterium]